MKGEAPITDEDEDAKDGEKKYKLSLLEIFNNKRAFFGLAYVFLACYTLSFNMPLINTYLDSIGYKPYFIGICISLAAFSYALGMPIVVMMTSKIQRRGVIFIGMFVMIVGFSLVGSGKFFKTQSVAALVISGMCIFGLGFSMIMGPVIPELLQALEQSEFYKARNIDTKALCNNIAGYAILGQGLGESFGPMSSSLLELKLKYNIYDCQHLLAFVMVVINLVYFITCGNLQFFGNAEVTG